MLGSTESIAIAGLSLLGSFDEFADVASPSRTRLCWPHDWLTTLANGAPGDACSAGLGQKETRDALGSAIEAPRQSADLVFSREAQALTSINNVVCAYAESPEPIETTRDATTNPRMRSHTWRSERTTDGMSGRSWPLVYIWAT